jgi:hypothetical protein
VSKGLHKTDARGERTANGKSVALSERLVLGVEERWRGRSASASARCSRFSRAFPIFGSVAEC